MASKQILREVYLEKRLSLTDKEYKVRNKSIVEQVISLIDTNSYHYIHLFLPITAKKEVNTYGIIEHYKAHNQIQIVVPKIEENGLMSHYVYDDQCVIENNKWGIPEPISGNLADLDKIDLVLVPLVIADKLGNRIGYGKGYYDRFLVQVPKAMKVGISLLPLLDEILHVEEIDIVLDKIICSI